MIRLIRWLVSVYQSLPIKPFRGIARKLYEKYKLLMKNKVVIATREGIKYKLNLSEQIDSSIYYTGCLEPMTTAVINKYVKKGMTVLDIGANVGCHTLRLAKLVGQNGTVIAFEPMPWALRRLKDNLELNNFNNIVVEKVALSNVNQRKQAYFRASWALDGGSSRDSIKKEEINFITLDEYIRISKIESIDFIKIDLGGV